MKKISIAIVALAICISVSLTVKDKAHADSGPGYIIGSMDSGPRY